MDTFLVLRQNLRHFFVFWDNTIDKTIIAGMTRGNSAAQLLYGPLIVPLAHCFIPLTLRASRDFLAARLFFLGIGVMRRECKKSAAALTSCAPSTYHPCASRRCCAGAGRGCGPTGNPARPAGPPAGAARCSPGTAPHTRPPHWSSSNWTCNCWAVELPRLRYTPRLHILLLGHLLDRVVILGAGVGARIVRQLRARAAALLLDLPLKLQPLSRPSYLACPFPVLSQNVVKVRSLPAQPYKKRQAKFSILSICCIRFISKRK